MAVSEFEQLVIEHDLVPAVAKAAHTAAAILLQMLIVERGNGDWVEELQQKLCNHLEREEPPYGHADRIRDMWHGAELDELRTIFAHRAFVFEGSERHH